MDRSRSVDNAYVVAVDVFRVVCGRLAERSADLRHLVGAGAPFDGWLEGEAYLACRGRQADQRFGEVAARPTYGSERVTGEDGRPSDERGGLLVGGVGEPGHHLWVFAEFVLLLDGDRRADDWRTRTEAAVARLLRLGWKRSASILVVAAAGRADVEADWAEDLDTLPAWHRPPLAPPCRLTLPGGGSAVVRAFDVKRDPADVLAAPAP
jgi:hypothetical protein